MCCPICTGVLQVSVPAIGDQEPVMSCQGCKAVLTSDFLGLYMDQALDRELVRELKQAA